MAELKNGRQEAFAAAVVAGRAANDAYREAGYKVTNDAVARVNGSRLLTNANVAARIAELKAAAADASVMTAREVLQEFSRLGRANMADFVHIPVSDDVVGAVRDLPRDQAAAIQELTVETYTEGGGDDSRQVKRVKFKLHDKRGALAELRRHYEPQQHEVTATIEVVSARERIARRLAELAAAGGAASNPGQSDRGGS